VSAANGPDPIDQLRAADPIRAGELPDASLARVSARIQEHIMSDTQQPSSTPSRRSIALVGGLGAVGVLAIAIALSSGPGLGVQAPGPIGAAPTSTPTADPVPSVEPPPTSDPGGGGAMASCIMYDPALLPTFETVFDGTVSAVDGDQVTFDVNVGWKGVDASVTLTALDTSVALLGPVPDFEVGGRYLVTAAGPNINACGYTLDYDADTAASWAGAFGG